MGKFVLAVIGIALFVYALFDLIATPRERVRYLPKPLWFVVVLLFIGIGPLLWLVMGRTRSAPGGGNRIPRPRPKPQGPRGPDDDPDYLRGL